MIAPMDGNPTHNYTFAEAARIDTITADVILLSLTAYAVTNHSRS